MRPPRLAPASISRRRAVSWFGLALASGTGASMAAIARAEDVPDFRVVVNPDNPLRVASVGYLADIFLKKVTRWENGEAIHPADLRADSQVRRRFSESVLKRSVGAVRSYWQQRIFSGRDVPPPELDSDDSVMAMVARFPGGIGYVSGSAKIVGVRELSIR